MKYNKLWNLHNMISIKISMIKDDLKDNFIEVLDMAFANWNNSPWQKTKAGLQQMNI